MGCFKKKCIVIFLCIYNRFCWICLHVSYKLRLCEVRTVKDFSISGVSKNCVKGKNVCQSKLTPTYDGLMIKILWFQAPYANQCVLLLKFSLSQFYCWVFFRIKDKKKKKKMLKLSFNCLCVCGIQLLKKEMPRLDHKLIKLGNQRLKNL